MKQCMDSKKLHARLNRIKGQVNGISNMIDQDIPCEDILIQINAVKSAIHKVGQLILEGHIHHCVKDAIDEGNSEEAIDKFSKAVSYFANLK